MDIPNDGTIGNLNTPFQNPKQEVSPEVIITDPTHPLFGRTFPLLSIGLRASQGGNVFVSYGKNITLRIPFSATNLAGRPESIASKLTGASIYDFVSLAKEYGVCHAPLQKSGRDCQTP